MSKKQKSGLYRTKVKIGVDANGNDVVKWISGKAKRELEDSRQFIAELAALVPDPPADYDPNNDPALVGAALV